MVRALIRFLVIFAALPLAVLPAWAAFAFIRPAPPWLDLAALAWMALAATACFGIADGMAKTRD